MKRGREKKPICPVEVRGGGRGRNQNCKGKRSPNACARNERKVAMNIPAR